MSLIELDKKLIWHPLTQHKVTSDPIFIESGKGSYLYDDKGKECIDLISSWWVNLYGHAHPKIAKAISDQATKLEQVVFCGLTHKPAVTLCDKMQSILPKELSKFFFSDNGSTSVEIALKMTYQYWKNKGEDKKLFLSFEGAYHGGTLGAMSVGGSQDPFSELFFDALRIPYPDTWNGDENIEAKEKNALEILRGHLDKHSKDISALIIEPLMQGASGMRLSRHSFVKSLVEIVRSHGILVIFDEVMTGFGRTGSYFAMNHLGVVPDFLCVSKGITGGFLPLALTITREEIYNEFLGDDLSKAFVHSHSYTANPIACAAGIAAFDLLVSEETKSAWGVIHETHEDCLSEMLENGCPIRNIRILGTISAFDLVEEKSWAEMQKLRLRFLEEGLILRPIGNTIYMIPPYSTSSEVLRKSYNVITEIIS